MGIGKTLILLVALICAILIAGTVHNLLFQTCASENSTEFLNPLFKHFNVDIMGRIGIIVGAIVLGIILMRAFKKS